MVMKRGAEDLENTCKKFCLVMIFKHLGIFLGFVAQFLFIFEKSQYPHASYLVIPCNQCDNSGSYCMTELAGSLLLHIYARQQKDHAFDETQWKGKDFIPSLRMVSDLKHIDCVLPGFSIKYFGPRLTKGQFMKLCENQR